MAEVEWIFLMSLVIQVGVGGSEFCAEVSNVFPSLDEIRSANFTIFPSSDPGGVDFREWIFPNTFQFPCGGNVTGWVFRSEPGITHFSDVVLPGLSVYEASPFNPLTFIFQSASGSADELSEIEPGLYQYTLQTPLHVQRGYFLGIRYDLTGPFLPVGFRDLGAVDRRSSPVSFWRQRLGSLAFDTTSGGITQDNRFQPLVTINQNLAPTTTEQPTEKHFTTEQPITKEEAGITTEGQSTSNGLASTITIEQPTEEHVTTEQPNTKEEAGITTEEQPTSKGIASTITTEQLSTTDQHTETPKLVVTSGQGLGTAEVTETVTTGNSTIAELSLDIIAGIVAGGGALILLLLVILVIIFIVKCFSRRETISLKTNPKESSHPHLRGDQSDFKDTEMHSFSKSGLHTNEAYGAFTSDHVTMSTNQAYGVAAKEQEVEYIYSTPFTQNDAYGVLGESKEQVIIYETVST